MSNSNVSRFDIRLGQERKEHVKKHVEGVKPVYAFIEEAIIEKLEKEGMGYGQRKDDKSV